MARIAEKLRDAPPECEDYVEYLCEIVEGADDGEVDDATFEAAFRFMERNAAAELGSPGPLVHFLERFYPRYLSRLVESVRRCPTFMTIWMVNRILNGEVDEPDRSELVSLLVSVSRSAEVDALLRQEAQDFLNLHVCEGP